MDYRILFISTKFRHHARMSGYDQLINYFPSHHIVGRNELNDNLPWWSKYKWVYELTGLQYRSRIDLVHILYGEEYLRFSPYLYRNIPVVASFHQPPDRLLFEIQHGGTSGRIYRLTHSITRGRFKHLDAAIVLEEAQKEVLLNFMPESKIHVIYHGVDTDYFRPNSDSKVVDSIPFVITTGEWQRDWILYLKVIAKAAEKGFPWKFKLVNRHLSDEILQQLSVYHNFEYVENASDQELLQLYQFAKVMFLPLKSGAGNNAVMESLSTGCPIVTTNVFHKSYQIKGDFIKFYPADQVTGILAGLRSFIDTDPKIQSDIAAAARKKMLTYDWASIAKETHLVYQGVSNNVGTSF